MTNIALLSLQQVTACVQADEDFAPPPLLFFQSDGVTPISLMGINFTSQIGSLATLTSAAGGGISVSGNSLTFYIPATQKNWPTGRYNFTLQAADGVYTKDIFANSSLTVGQPASWSVTAYSSGGSSDALSGLSGAALSASIANMTVSQQQSVMSALLDAQAAYIPSLDFSHVANSQYAALSPFTITLK